MKILQEFKEFAVRGNAIDLAVGIIIGASFNAIVSALVDNIVMPPLSIITGGVNFADKEIVLRQATENSDAVAIGYGMLLDAVIEFILIAFVVFLIVRYINSLKRKDEPKEKAPAPRICNFCKEGIAQDAIRCPHCTAKLQTNH